MRFLNALKAARTSLTTACFLLSGQLSAEEINYYEAQNVVLKSFPSVSFVDAQNCAGGSCEILIVHAANHSVQYARGMIERDPHKRPASFQILANQKIFEVAPDCANKLTHSKLILTLNFIGGGRVVLERSQIKPREPNYCESGISSGEFGTIVTFETLRDETSVTVFHNKQGN